MSFLFVELFVLVVVFSFTAGPHLAARWRRKTAKPQSKCKDPFCYVCLTGDGVQIDVVKMKQYEASKWRWYERIRPILTQLWRTPQQIRRILQKLWILPQTLFKQNNEIEHLRSSLWSLRSYVYAQKQNDAGINKKAPEAEPEEEEEEEEEEQEEKGSL